MSHAKAGPKELRALREVKAAKPKKIIPFWLSNQSMVGNVILANGGGKGSPNRPKQKGKTNGRG